MYKQLFTSLSMADMNFLRYIATHQGEAAAALSDMAFYTTCIQSQQYNNANGLDEFVLSECSC